MTSLPGSPEDHNVQRAVADHAGGDYPHGRPHPEAPRTLTAEERAHFIANGFVVLRGMYTASYVGALKERASQVLRRAVPDQLPSVGRDSWADAENKNAQEVLAARRSAGSSNPLWAANDPGTQDLFNPDRVTYIDNLHTHHADFDRHLRDPKLVLLLSELLGGDIDCYQCCSVVKPPKHDNESHGWHQDITYYGSPTFGNRNYRGMTNFGNLCCITYLAAAAPDRGATSVIPGTHRTAEPDRTQAREGPLLLGSSITPLLDLPTRWAEGLEALLPRAVTPTYAAGDVLLFDSWVLHRANSNTSDENMVGLVNVYCRPDCVPLEPPPTPHARMAAEDEGAPSLMILRGGEFVGGGGGGGGSTGTGTGTGTGQCYGGGADARALL